MQRLSGASLIVIFGGREVGSTQNNIAAISLVTSLNGWNGHGCDDKALRLVSITLVVGSCIGRFRINSASLMLLVF